jgi:acyl carrier protein
MAIRRLKRDEARCGRNLEVRALIARYLKVDLRRMTDTAHFVDDLGADWLDHLELLILIEECFPGMQITEQAAEQLQTVGDLIHYITYWDQRSTATTRAPGALTRGSQA